MGTPTMAPAIHISLMFKLLNPIPPHQKNPFTQKIIPSVSFNTGVSFYWISFISICTCSILPLHLLPNFCVLL